MEKHVTILGAFFLALSIQGLLGAFIVFIAVTGGGLLSGEMEAIAITSTVGTIIGGLLLLLSLPGLVAGIGLIQRRPWARILTLILSFLLLLKIPLGTALGIYGIWVLMQDEAARIFAGDGAQGAGGNTMAQE